MSAVCSTSNVRFCCCCCACGACGKALGLSTNPQALDRRAELSGLRDDITNASLLVEACKTTRAVEDSQAAVGVFVHTHGRAHIVPAMLLRRNLQAAPVPGDAVVGANDAVLLDAEHVADRPADIADEGRAGLRRRHRETGGVGGPE